MGAERAGAATFTGDALGLLGIIALRSRRRQVSCGPGWGSACRPEGPRPRPHPFLSHLALDVT